MDYTRAEPCFAGVLYGLSRASRSNEWHNGIWDVMQININNVRPLRTWDLFVDAAASGL